MIKKLTLTLVLAALALSACQPSAGDDPASLNDEPFELYLVAETAIGQEIEDIEELPLVNVPLLTIDDFINYYWEAHAFDLTPEAYQTLVAVFSAGLPTDGVPFVVKSYGERIYSGAFYSLLSSTSYDGVVIFEPMDPAGMTMFVVLGYPSSDFFTGEDPRAHANLKQAFEEAGVLRE